MSLAASLGVFFISLMFVLGVSSFVSAWGDKTQLLAPRVYWACAGSATLAGVTATLVPLLLDVEGYSQRLVPTLATAVIVPIVVNLVAKRVAYRTIPYRRIQGIKVLEPGKVLIEVKDLKVYYPLFGGFFQRKVGEVRAVDGVSFTIKTGETLGLVGESGCGKTTIGKAILGLVERTGGQIVFDGKPIGTPYPSSLRQRIQIVFQDPDASLNPRMKVVDIISEPLRNLLGITDKKELRRRVYELMQQVSLKREHLDRFPHEFSGGQKQRIIIARALACNPALIILDEPTSALDVSVQAQILNLLRDLQEKYNYAFLFITHNLSVVNHIAHKVAVMYLGQFVEVGTVDQIFTNPVHPYTRALLSARSEIDPERRRRKIILTGEVPSPVNPPSGCRFNPRCTSDARTEECALKQPVPRQVEDGHVYWCVNAQDE